MVFAYSKNDSVIQAAVSLFQLLRLHFFAVLSQHTQQMP